MDVANNLKLIVYRMSNALKAKMVNIVVIKQLNATVNALIQKIMKP